jgi:hypothetical protein
MWGDFFMSLLPFFPTPYPDELFYSIVARYHKRSDNDTVMQTMYELFGSEGRRAKIDFPNSLQVLCDQLPKGSLNTPYKLIYEHTPFNLYSHFISKNARDKAINGMLSNAKHVPQILGSTPSHIKPPSHLQYCAECFKDDIEKYGEPYWHVIHQVPNVFFCPIHEIPLTQSNVSRFDLGIKSDLVPLSNNIEHINREDNVVQYAQHQYCKNSILDVKKSCTV